MRSVLYHAGAYRRLKCRGCRCVTLQRRRYLIAQRFAEPTAQLCLAFDIIQAIITTDNYLGYSLESLLIFEARTAAAALSDDISLWIEKLKQTAIVGRLQCSCITRALNQLRALSWQQKRYQIYLLVSDKTLLNTVYPYGWAFFVSVTTTNTAQYAETLLSTANLIGKL